MESVKNPLGERTPPRLTKTIAIHLPNAIISTFAANPPIMHRNVDSPAVGRR